MRRLSATTAEELGEIASAIRDAYLEAEDLEYDEHAERIVVRFAQEAGPREDLPQKQVVRRPWLFTEYHVPFMRGTLTINHVTDLDAPEGWDDMGMLVGVDFDAERSRVSLYSNDPLRATVERLSVTAEVAGDVAFYVRRRVYPFGLVADSR
jgi:hypothetical protein